MKITKHNYDLVEMDPFEYRRYPDGRWMYPCWIEDTDPGRVHWLSVDANEVIVLEAMYQEAIRETL